MKKSFLIIIVGLFIIFQPVLLSGQGFPGGSGDPFAGMDRAFGTQDDTDITMVDEYYLGRAVAANVLKTYKPYTRNEELTIYLNRICQSLVINSSRPVLFNGYHVLVLDTPEFNAFATPGGHIFVTRGLVEAATSEDALAALIAHEIAHIILRHGVNLIEDMKITEEIADMARRGAALSNSPGAQRALAMRNSVSGIVDTMMKNGYSRDQEYEADKTAIELLAATGYDPNGLVDMLRILQRVQGSQRGGFNSTHPAPQDRIARIGNTAARFRTEDTKAARTGRFRNK